ncbi:MAG: GIY-YIG nuclease family protein [Smithella sp.]
MLNTILKEAGLDLSNVRLLRHKDKNAVKGRSPYELWRDDLPSFELYQSVQSFNNRAKLVSRYWLSFIVTPSNETMFADFYSSCYRGLLEKDTPMPHMDGIDRAGTCDVYNLVRDDRLNDFIGKLYIDWGSGERAWIQRPERQNKKITKLLPEFKEPDFPGFLHFMKPLSELNRIPFGWITTLRSSKGIYLLTCPTTREQYVGSASGQDGFWGRWQEYIQNGHGGNIALKSRDPSDYQVSILEVAGTATTLDDLLKMEIQWKQKLQSREMGLNKN